MLDYYNFHCIERNVLFHMEKQYNEIQKDINILKEIQNKLKQKIEDADLILIGIGSELKTEKENQQIFHTLDILVKEDSTFLLKNLFSLLS